VHDRIATAKCRDDVRGHGDTRLVAAYRHHIGIARLIRSSDRHPPAKHCRHRLEEL